LASYTLKEPKLLDLFAQAGPDADSRDSQAGQAEKNPDIHIDASHMDNV
jgi:hypothetical protein